MTAELGKR